MSVTVLNARFVGRRAELAELREGAASAADGRAVTYVIGGEAGVGKTRLIREFLAHARGQGATTLVGGCLDLSEVDLPLWPFVEALRTYADELDDETRAELFPSDGFSLGRILPELGGATAAAASAPGASAQGQLFELVHALLARLADRSPLILVLEDLHWADRSTRDLLAFLARSLRSERIMLVGTYRSDELYRGHPLRALLAELYRARMVQRLDLRPFDCGEVAEHLAGILGAPPAPALVESVFRRSEGNAFFAEELVAASREDEAAELSSTLRDILLTRIERRSPAAQEVLRVAAVGGRSVAVGLLEAVCSLPPRERSDALREAVAHQLLVTQAPDTYAFRHALLREAVYEELLPGERRELHVGYGSALSAHPELAGGAAIVAGELAYHWFAAHDLPRALDAAIVAGSVAQSRWGFAEAGAHFERALDVWDSVPDAATRTGLDHLTLSRRAAEAANLAGDHARAGALIRAALERVDADDAGLLWERLGRYLWAAGDSDAALGAYEQALRLVPEDPPSAARARVLAAHGQSLMLLARFQDATTRCGQAIEIARKVGARAEEGHALNTLGCALGFLGDPAGGVAHLSRALEIAHEVGDLDDIGRAYQNLSEILAGPLNRLEEALELALEGQRLAERLGLARDYGVSLEVNAATALLALGRWDQADAILRAAQDRQPVETAAIELYLSRGRLAVARGALEHAEQHLAAAQRLMISVIDPQFQSMLAAYRGELALWQGNPAEARVSVATGLRCLEASDDAWFVGPLLWLGARAEADARGLRLSEDPRTPAFAAADVLVARARTIVEAAGAGGRFISPVTVAYARLCEAEGERLAHGAEPDAWRSAAVAWETVGHPYPLAYARWREAEALLARRRAQEGRAALRAANAIAQKLGAGALAREIGMLARRARIELNVAERAETAARPGPAQQLGLTPRELQVLALVAAGRTNREIAQALFVTEKTAGAHVSNILAKLNARGRVEAATAAQRLGLLASV
ncbi:MAG: AAA family ATPase [Actinobacteria bacterium]|nr:AAA family ATPase [Actinomycetota bacterium]